MNKAWRFVLTGGVVAGAFDIVYACVFWAIKRAVSPHRILQRVASGWIGDTSMTGGWVTAVLGFLTHFFIAITMAVAYYVVARRISALWERPIRYGLAYGLLLYGIMNYVVVPLSRAGASSKDPLWVAMSIVVHMFLIGLPIALYARRAVLSDLRSPVTAAAV